MNNIEDIKNIEKYGAFDALTLIIREKMAGPINNAAMRMGCEFMKMKPSHRSILATLFYRGELSVKELALLSNISFANISKPIDELLMLGYVERHENKNNRRYINVSITNKARKIIEDGNTLVNKISEFYYNSFYNPEQKKQLIDDVISLWNLIDILNPNILDSIKDENELDKVLVNFNKNNTTEGI